VYFTLVLQGLLHCLLHAGGEGNSWETQEINGKTEAIWTRPKLGERRERPHPLTHGASRLPWGRSRLSHEQRVTHSAASQSRSSGVVRQRSLQTVSGG